MDNIKSEEFRLEIDKWYRWFNRGARLWSFAFHFCLFGTTIITILIGFLSQLNEETYFPILGMNKDFLISLLAFIAAVLSGVIAKGGLGKKWKSNRVSRELIEEIYIDLMMDNPDYKIIAGQLKEIVRNHTKVITGNDATEEVTK